jgi:hypothetical protein
MIQWIWACLTSGHLKCWSRKWRIGISKALKKFGIWCKRVEWNEFGWWLQGFCRIDRKTNSVREENGEYFPTSTKFLLTLLNRASNRKEPGTFRHPISFESCGCCSLAAGDFLVLNVWCQNSRYRANIQSELRCIAVVSVIVWDRNRNMVFKTVRKIDFDWSPLIVKTAIYFGFIKIFNRTRFSGGRASSELALLATDFVFDWANQGTFRIHIGYFSQNQNFWLHFQRAISSVGCWTWIHSQIGFWIEDESFFRLLFLVSSQTLKNPRYGTLSDACIQILDRTFNLTFAIPDSSR